MELNVLRKAIDCKQPDKVAVIGGEDGLLAQYNVLTLHNLKKDEFISQLEKALNDMVKIEDGAIVDKDEDFFTDKSEVKKLTYGDINDLFDYQEFIGLSKKDDTEADYAKVVSYLKENGIESFELEVIEQGCGINHEKASLIMRKLIENGFAFSTLGVYLPTNNNKRLVAFNESIYGLRDKPKLLKDNDEVVTVYQLLPNFYFTD